MNHLHVIKFNPRWLFLIQPFVLTACTQETVVEGKPNIIFIMADDLGYGDLGCYGAETIRTPNIDKLAENGMRFTDAHSSAAVCTPTRYGILTGRYSWRGRLKKEVLWCGYTRSLIEPGRKTIGNMMQESGYRTAQIGKWHLGWEDEEPVDYGKGYLGRGPKELGFDYSFVTASAHNLSPIVFVENHQILSNLIPLDRHVYYPDFLKGPMPEHLIKWHDDKDLGPLMIADDWQPELVDQIYTEKSVDFIIRHVEENKDRPFYLHLTPEAPHRPNIVPDFMKGTSDSGIRGDHIQMFDWMVGEIMNALKRLEVDQNTLIIVTSDNGPTGGRDGSFDHKAAGELRGYKGGLYEGGHRVPFIAHWPGKIEPGSETNILICLTDMMASFAALLDYQLDEDMGEDSFNILPAFFGEQDEIRETMINRDYHGKLSIRKGPWKLVGEELYNLDTDFKESQDMAQDHPEIVESLKDLLQQQIAAGRITHVQ